MDFLKRRIACAEICDNGIDDDGDGWIDCNDPDCFEFYERNRSASSCIGQAIFREFENQKFGFLVKLPTDSIYPFVNFTEEDMEIAMNNCFKQVNISWTVNPIDRYEYDFDENKDGFLSGDEYYYFLHDSLRIYKDTLYQQRYYPSDSTLFKLTSTVILYGKIKHSSGWIPNGWYASGDIYGVVNCGYQTVKRTMAHENGHRLGYEHPWEEFKGKYKQFDDGPALMDYVDLLTGYKIRAYQWKD